MVEVATGAVVRSAKVDGGLDDLFSLQDRVVIELSGLSPRGSPATPAFDEATLAAPDEATPSGLTPEGPPVVSAAPVSEQARTRADALRVFLDCLRCDDDFLRAEITFVNYVRDRQDAQVHVLVTTQRSGAGTEYTLAFIGLEEFTGIDVTLRYGSSTTDTTDEVRRALARRFAFGLALYVAPAFPTDPNDVAQVPGADHVSVMAQPEDDPWNFWVFRTRVSTRVSGEESRTARSFRGSFSADRTTEQWKTRIGLNASHNKSVFELSDGRRFTNITRNYALDGRVIKSLGAHAGLGFGGSVVTSTFLNQDLSLRLAPAFEYNVFPYSESTRRQFTLTYSLGVNSFNYEEPTIFDKTAEVRADESLIFSLDFTEPWGDAGVAFEFSHLLDDLDQHRGVVFGNIDLRLARGLSLNLSGRASRIRDQIFLSRSELADEDVLLLRRQLVTDYDYRFSFGITYAFGSIYNNVVNSRFAGSSGGFVRAF